MRSGRLLDPAQLPSLKARFETYGMASSGTVTTWNDISGHGFNASQRTAAPTLAANIFGTVPGLQFASASSQSLFISTYPIAGNDFTVFFVAQTSQLGANTTTFYSNPGVVNCEMPGSVNDWGTAIGSDGGLLGGTGNPDGVTDSGANTFSTGIPVLATFRRTQSTGTYIIRIDGTQKSSNSGQSTATLNSPTGVGIGEVYNTSGEFYNGYLGAVLLYDAALADATCTSIENFLMSRYHVTPPPASTFVSVSGANTSNTQQTSLSVPAPSGIVSGNLLTAVIAGGFTSSLLGTITPPTGWTLQGTVQNNSAGNGNETMAVYTKPAGSSEPASYVWSWANPAFAYVAIVQNASTSGVFDGGTPLYGTSTGANVTAPSATPTVANDYDIVACGQSDNGITWTTPSSFTVLYSAGVLGAVYGRQWTGMSATGATTCVGQSGQSELGVRVLVKP